MRVPVLAYAASAVPATLDGGGVLYQDRDPGHVALVADAVLSDHTLQERVLAAQDAALDRLVKKDFGGTLLSFVDQVASAPRIAPPRVTFDFWDQLAAYEQLEELRMFRPGVFKGLPLK